LANSTEHIPNIQTGVQQANSACINFFSKSNSKVLNIIAKIICGLRDGVKWIFTKLGLDPFNAMFMIALALALILLLIWGFKHSENWFLKILFIILIIIVVIVLIGAL